MQDTEGRVQNKLSLLTVKHFINLEREDIVQALRPAAWRKKALDNGNIAFIGQFCEHSYKNTAKNT